MQCGVEIADFSQCDGIISLELAIKAIVDVSLRIRMIMSFTDCSYIPFLIRWDLVPPWVSDTENSKKLLI